MEYEGHGEFVRPPSAADRWMKEQLFEEDVRAVLKMMRPHRRERLAGWAEYRTGGSNFRVTISWDEDFEREPMEDRTPGECRGSASSPFAVPQLAKVLETVLVGSARDGDELSPQEEFALYRSVALELARRLEELESCYT